MSRTTLDSVPTVSGTRTRGRHRIETPGGVRCSDLPGVRERLPQRRTATAFLRTLLPSVSAGRHTWDALVNAGGGAPPGLSVLLLPLFFPPPRPTPGPPGNQAAPPPHGWGGGTRRAA